MSSNKLVVCPYDEAHKVKESRIQIHIAKCKLNHLNKEAPFICPFNATHVYPQQERNYHLSNCPDRAVLDRMVSDPVNQNNPFKGRTAVPSYSEPIVVESEEVWEVDDGEAGYCPTKEAPIGAIVEPKPLSKPSSRRQLYKDLHQLPCDLNTKSNIAVAPIPPPVPPRQPNQPCEALRNFDQAAKLQNLGRGRSSSRIAANIYNQPTVNNVALAQSNYSSITSGMRNLGLGRGQPNTAPTNQMQVNDEDFPALGAIRRVTKPPQKQEF